MVYIHRLLHPLPDVYREYGKKRIDQIFAYNKKAQMTGEVMIKVSSIVNEIAYSS